MNNALTINAVISGRQSAYENGTRCMAVVDRWVRIAKCKSLGKRLYQVHPPHEVQSGHTQHSGMMRQKPSDHFRDSGRALSDEDSLARATSDLPAAAWAVFVLAGDSSL